LKYVEIKSFVIGLVSFPAPKDDADPFEGQDADGAVVRFAFFPLGLVEGFAPFGPRDRLAGELAIRGTLGGRVERFTQQDFPLRSTTGAMPLVFWIWLASDQRERSAPKAHSNRGAN
jgi:hypothetical protein